MEKILAIFRVPEMSKEKYDNVMKDLETAGLYTVKTRTYHCMALDNKGTVVVDVWDSSDALDEFFKTLGPILSKNGMNPPQPEILPVHNIIL